MATGSVKTVVATRGFGFITPDENGPDIFFHMSDLPQSLPFDGTLQARRVEFEIADTDKGPRAVRVRVRDW